MASTQLDAPSLEASWFRAAPRAMGDFADPSAAAVRGVRRARRQRIVKALGCIAIAGLCGLAAWMAASTPVRDEIASWGTLGSATQVRLTPSSPEDTAPVPPELDLGTGTIVWAAGGDVAMQAASPRSPAMAPALAEPTATRPARRASRSDPDDPYADAVAPAHDATSDPY